MNTFRPNGDLLVVIAMQAGELLLPNPVESQAIVNTG